MESAIAWKAAVENDNGPTSLLFSRQSLAHILRTDEQIRQIEYGGYILTGGAEEPDVIIIATGSEISIAMHTAEKMNNRGKRIRVVSMPSTDVFDAQPQEYRDTVLPPACRKRIAVEAGVSDYWRKYVGLDGMVLGIDRFGESAPAAVLYEHFGLTEAILTGITESLLV